MGDDNMNAYTGERIGSPESDQATAGGYWCGDDDL